MNFKEKLIELKNKRDNNIEFRGKYLDKIFKLENRIDYIKKLKKNNRYNFISLLIIFALYLPLYNVSVIANLSWLVCTLFITLGIVKNEVSINKALNKKSINDLEIELYNSKIDLKLCEDYINMIDEEINSVSNYVNEPILVEDVIVTDCVKKLVK